MNFRALNNWALTFSVGMFLSCAVASGADEVTQDRAAQDGVEVLARGPVHEAFAEAVTDRPQATPIVPKQPPKPVDELPAEQKPEGENVQWVPGYWNWDDERSDYLWVSGFWRVPPPNRQWLPGSWRQTDGGWQWVSGSGADASPYFRIFNPIIQG